MHNDIFREKDKIKKRNIKNIITVLLIVYIFCISEFLSFIMLRKENNNFVLNYNNQAAKDGSAFLSYRYAPVKIFNQKINQEELRKQCIGEKNKGSVLFFGGDYMYGAGLDEKDTIPYLINKQTGMTTVNKSFYGENILNMLNYLSDENFYKSLEENLPVKYVVYLYINDHLNKIINPYISNMIFENEYNYTVHPYYIIDKQYNLEIKKPFIIKRLLYVLYSTKAYYSFYARKFLKEDTEQIMYKLLMAAKKITDRKFEGSRFVIIVYKDGSNIGMNEALWNRLESQGFIMLDAEKLAGHELDSEKWRGADNEHPSAAANLDIAKSLSKILK